MRSSKSRVKRVLLLEPNYPNKYPPVGLMKLATYYRRLGWEVTFYKGDYDRFVADRLVLLLLKDLGAVAGNVCWGKYYEVLMEAVQKRKNKPLMEVLSGIQDILSVVRLVSQYQEEYKSRLYFARKEWDRVCVTTLFTFYAKETVEAIEFAKKLVPKERIQVGGVMASLVPDYIESTTGVTVTRGLLECPSVCGDKVTWKENIDDLPLDYSILEEIDYKYPAADAHFAHTTRGCVNKCKFCAVPTLEPRYKGYVSLLEKIEYERRMFGPKRNLLLMDNNVFASKDFPKIIDDIKSLGFGAGAKMADVDPLSICKARVADGYNWRAFIKMGVGHIKALRPRIKSQEEADRFEAALKECNADGDWHGVSRESFLDLCDRLSDLTSKYWRPSLKQVSVDYNQGLDSRLSMKQGVMDKLAECAIKPVRIAFDHWELRRVYEDAIGMAAKAGLKQMSNYVLYNFTDTPDELYFRLRLNIALCEELGVSIYSFPMKYHPIKDEAWFSNRNYLGNYWCRKYIRFVQVVLNSTMGKVGKGKPFFMKAFGETVDEFRTLMLMPEAFLLKRWDCELSGEIARWKDALAALEGEDLEIVKKLIVYNTYHDPKLWAQYSDRVRDFMDMYLIGQSSIKPVSDSVRRRAIAKYDEKWSGVSVRMSEREIARVVKSLKSWPFLVFHEGGEL